MVVVSAPAYACSLTGFHWTLRTTDSACEHGISPTSCKATRNLSMVLRFQVESAHSTMDEERPRILFVCLSGLDIAQK